MTDFLGVQRSRATSSLLVAATAVAVVHCSSAGDAARPTDPALDAASQIDAAATTSLGAPEAPVDGGSANDGETGPFSGPSAACVSYCDQLAMTCNADYPQFGSTTACLNGCSFYPPGTADDPINEGNTLKCRVFHTMAGSLHCLHGGPYGYGGCGSMCEGFCQIAMGWCPASKTGAPFASLATCESTCEQWAWAPNGADGAAAYRATSPTTGNTLDCREVQLVMSLESASARDTYCPLAADDSASCR